MLLQTNSKGASATLLREMLFKEIETQRTKDDKQLIERLAYVAWSFNVTVDRYWKALVG
jgi:hypothetical protein